MVFRNMIKSVGIKHSYISHFDYL